jgi:hypothetical protein
LQRSDWTVIGVVLVLDTISTIAIIAIAHHNFASRPDMA